MRILIADDDLQTAELVQKVVQKTEHQADLVFDGLEAWEAVQIKNYRIVITDWVMPKLDGPTLCRKVRQAGFSNYIYMILLTGKNQSKDAVEGLSAGADDFIIKPFYPEELRARIRSGQRIIELEDQYRKTLGQLVQTEKLAAIGQLAAGVAHEINNPTGFVTSNLKTLSDYQKDLSALLFQYRELADFLREKSLDCMGRLDAVKAMESEMDLNYILTDMPELIQDCREGMERIKKIVMDLKDFAHPGEDGLQLSDINQNIDSTLNVVWNELKYKATVEKKYGTLPLIECYPHQLNQVFMNILVNAAQAIKDKGTIQIATRALDGCIEIQISDTGIGIPANDLEKIFDPFFTTKGPDKGLGLGMHIAYGIVQKHGGTIKVDSMVDKGTTFVITLPQKFNKQ